MSKPLRAIGVPRILAAIAFFIVMFILYVIEKIV